MTEKERTILFVDDEVNILNALKRLLRSENYHMLTATSGRDGLEVLKNNKVQIVISDQRMPEMSGTEFLANVKEDYPDILRIILTGYTDVDSITDSINKGHVYKFFLKPWNDQNLKLEIRQAFEQVELIRTNKQLDQTVAKQNSELQNINESLEQLVAERMKEIELQNQALGLSHEVLENVPFCIFGVDSNGIIVQANRKARSMPCGSNVTIGIHMETCFPDSVGKAFQEVLASNEFRNVDLDMGEAGQVCVNLSPLSGNSGRQGVVITMHTL